MQTNNEDKILSMLDLIVSELKNTKCELQEFKDEMLQFKDEMLQFKDEMLQFKGETEARFDRIEKNMVTKDEFDKFGRELETKLVNLIDLKINEQNAMLEAQFRALNERVFRQEAQMELLREKEKAL